MASVHSKLLRLRKRFRLVRDNPVLLVGGAKYRSEKRDGTRVSVKTGQSITPFDGSNSEGGVYNSELVLKRGKRERRLPVVEKRYRHNDASFFGEDRSVSNPERQFKIFELLTRLNREQKLGLHLNPIRIDLDHVSYFHEVREGLLGDEQHYMVKRHVPRFFSKPLHIMQDVRFDDEFLKDCNRQRKILGAIGFDCSSDAFFPVFNLRTKKLEAIIGDYGGIDVKDESRIPPTRWSRRLILKIKEWLKKKKK